MFPPCLSIPYPESMNKLNINMEKLECVLWIYGWKSHTFLLK